MTNAERILNRLDELLQNPTELTLFGRAAFQMGFPDAAAAYGRSVDVDLVICRGEAERLLTQTNFWQALEQLNRDLEAEGLFLSHIFEDRQLILTPEWREQRVKLAGTWKRIQLWRLGNGDLFLTKLMRFDPADLEDAQFLIRVSGWDAATVKKWVDRAVVPDVPELKEQFDLCVNEILRYV